MQIIQSNQNVTHIVQRNDLAMGHAPNIRCPEGTRVIALYKSKIFLPSENKSTPNYNNLNGKWLAGTVGAKPLMQNRFEYLVMLIFFNLYYMI